MMLGSNLESIFFSGTGHSPPCAELVSPSSWWICSTYCFFMNTEKHLPVELMSTGLSHESAGGLLLGSWVNCTLSPGPTWSLLPYACSTVAWGGNISESAFAAWITVAGVLGFTLPKKASRASKVQDYTGHVLFLQQKVINERISVVNSQGFFIIYLYFYTIHLSITWNFHRHQQALWYFFFPLLGNIMYSVIQFYCLCLGISQNECWWNSQLIRDEQTFKKSWTKKWLFPTSLTNTN